MLLETYDHSSQWQHSHFELIFRRNYFFLWQSPVSQVDWPSVDLLWGKLVLLENFKKK